MELIELLSICGFEHREFFSQINGLFNPNLASDRALLEQQWVSARNWNICIASRTDAFFARKGRLPSMELAPETVGAASPRDGLLGAFRIKDQEKFVATLYRSILHREPDAEGLAHYAAEPANLFSRLRMIMTFLNSEERKTRLSNGRR